MAGVATVTASAVLVAPSVQPLPLPNRRFNWRPRVQLLQRSRHFCSSCVRSTGTTDSWQRSRSSRRACGTPRRTRAAPTAARSIGHARHLESAYHAIEPWVDYGFEVGAWAFGWVPWVGWLTGRSWIFYNFGERLSMPSSSTSLTGSTATAASTKLGAIGATDHRRPDPVGNRRWNFLLPPLPLAAAPVHTSPTPDRRRRSWARRPAPEVESRIRRLVRSLLDRVLETPSTPTESRRPFKVGASLSSLIKNGIAGFGDLLGVPLSPRRTGEDVGDQHHPVDRQNPIRAAQLPADSRRHRSGHDETPQVRWPR